MREREREKERERENIKIVIVINVDFPYNNVVQFALRGMLLDCLSSTHNALASPCNILYYGSMPVTRNKVQLVSV